MPSGPSNEELFGKNGRRGRTNSEMAYSARIHQYRSKRVVFDGK